MAEGRLYLHPKTSDTFYLDKVKQSGNVTSRQLAQITGKTQGTTKMVLLSLFRKGLLKREKVWSQGGVRRYCYSVL